MELRNNFAGQRALALIGLTTCIASPAMMLDAVINANSPFHFYLSHAPVALGVSVFCLFMALRLHDWMVSSGWLDYGYSFAITACAVIADLAATIAVVGSSR
jgi:hypothetical protein